MNFIRKYSLMMLLLTGAMTIVSCSDDAEEFKASNKSIQLLASNPGYESETRTLLDENEKPMWSGDEYLRVYSNAYGSNPFMFKAMGRYPSVNATFDLQANDADIDRWFDYYDSPETKYYAVTHAPQGCFFDSNSEEIVTRIGVGESHDIVNPVMGPKVLNMKLGNISSEEDLLIGQRIEKPAMDVEQGTVHIRFKRFTGIMKIKLIDNTSTHELNGFKGVQGWISTGTDPYGAEQPDLYSKNNFGGLAKIGMGDNNLYNFSKESCTGLQLKTAASEPQEYFYDFNGEGNEQYMYVSVLPTKLGFGDSFSFALGNGEGKVVMKKINLDSNFEIKSCHIHEISLIVNDEDIHTGNPFTK